MSRTSPFRASTSLKNRPAKDPYRDKKRISAYDMEFYPTLESLHMAPYDPLDP